MAYRNGVEFQPGCGWQDGAREGTPPGLSVRGQAVSTPPMLTRAGTHLPLLAADPWPSASESLLSVRCGKRDHILYYLETKKERRGNDHHHVQSVLSGGPLPTASCHPYIQWVNFSCRHDLFQVYFRKEMQKTSS